MNRAQQERINAAELPASSVVAVLLDQHADIRDLFDQTMRAHGDARRQAFEKLRGLLAVHEAGEEILLRPLSQRAAHGEVARARDGEEQGAAAVLVQLERLDVADPAFAARLAELEQAVFEHEDAEETEKFPFVLATVDPERQAAMGRRILEVQRSAPQHPTGSEPFTALLGQARAAFSLPAA